MNKVIIFGKCVGNFQLRYTNNNNIPYCKFLLETKRRYQSKEYVDYIRCVAWGELAKRLTSLKKVKNTLLLVEGRLTSSKFVLQNNNYSNEEKNSHDNPKISHSLEVTVQNILFEYEFKSFSPNKSVNNFNFNSKVNKNDYHNEINQNNNEDDENNVEGPSFEEYLKNN